MSEKLNHHYVPQYHFRLFTGGKRYVHLASRDGSRFVRFASVKGQCARHKFYRHRQVEEWLSNLESYHATTYRAIVDIAWNSRAAPLSSEEDRHLREAVVLQHSRTPRNARLRASSTDQMMLNTYCEYLKPLPATPERQATIEAIERGKATLKNSQFINLMLSLGMAPRAATAISDLSLLILRNRTMAPFILCDAPCVFSNHYMRRITYAGVLGLMTPGLMAVLPINTRTQVLFYDAAVYRPDYVTAGCIDVFGIGDVSLLNALQVHSAEENVYFSDISAETYLRELLFAHRRLLQQTRGVFITHKPGEILIDGAPNRHEVLHVFEPQLPITLDLSFMSTAPLQPGENPNRPRNLSMVQAIEEALPISSVPSPVGIDELVKWIETEIHVPEN